MVLDVISVGSNQGCPTATLCRAIVERFPDVEVATGGGIRGLDDLHLLAGIGCAAALVSTALHDGRIGPKCLRQFET
jgi:phosphoribosylformimino-5-aminoimidazole carboxamide ribotide isomerase